MGHELLLWWLAANLFCIVHRPYIQRTVKELTLVAEVRLGQSTLLSLLARLARLGCDCCYDGACIRYEHTVQLQPDGYCILSAQ